MPDCSHEEADTRIVVHVRDAIRKGMKSICIRTVDTDILIILIWKFHFLKDLCKDLELKVAFGVRKDFAVYSVNNICSTLGFDKSKIMSMFHAFSGCDTTSSFHGRGKKSAWESLVSFPDVKVAFQYLVDHPFEVLEISSPHFKLTERFTVALYDRTSTSDSVNKARRELFSQKNHSLENLPPTQDALLQHVLSVTYQSGIWTNSVISDFEIPSPGEWGWRLEDGQWQPIWTTLPPAAIACTELINCNCKKSCTRCKCSRASLPCTDLCRCQFQK